MTDSQEERGKEGRRDRRTSWREERKTGKEISKKRTEGKVDKKRIKRKEGQSEEESRGGSDSVRKTGNRKQETEKITDWIKRQQDKR